MRRTEPVKIGDVVDDFFKNNERLGRMLDEARAVDLWAEVAGKAAASCTTRINFSRGKMFVYISSSVVRHEIFMCRNEIVHDINQALGREVVKGIIIK